MDKEKKKKKPVARELEKPEVNVAGQRLQDFGLTIPLYVYPLKETDTMNLFHKEVIVPITYKDNVAKLRFTPESSSLMIHLVACVCTAMVVKGDSPVGIQTGEEGTTKPVFPASQILHDVSYLRVYFPGEILLQPDVWYMAPDVDNYKVRKWLPNITLENYKDGIEWVVEATHEKRCYAQYDSPLGQLVRMYNRTMKEPLEEVTFPKPHKGRGFNLYEAEANNFLEKMLQSFSDPRLPIRLQTFHFKANSVEQSSWSIYVKLHLFYSIRMM
jgi:hypothetical protein